MTTLNARANAAYHALIAEYESEMPGRVWAGFDHERDAYEEGWADGYEAAAAEVAEKIAEIAEEAADDLDLPVMSEWLDQRDWFKIQLHALAAKARKAGGQS